MNHQYSDMIDQRHYKYEYHLYIHWYLNEIKQRLKSVLIELYRNIIMVICCSNLTCSNLKSTIITHMCICAHKKYNYNSQLYLYT